MALLQGAGSGARTHQRLGYRPRGEDEMKEGNVGKQRAVNSPLNVTPAVPLRLNFHAAWLQNKSSSPCIHLL